MRRFRNPEDYAAWERAQEEKFDQLKEEGLLRRPLPIPKEEDMKDDEEVFECEARCKRETPKALLCEIEGDEYWIPKSQIHDDSEVYDAGENREGVLIVSEWIAKQKGLL